MSSLRITHTAGERGRVPIVSLAVSISGLIGGLACGQLLAPPVALAAPTAKPAAIFSPQGVSAALKGAAGRVTVSVLLRSQPVLEAAQAPGRQRALAGRALTQHPEARRSRALQVVGRAGGTAIKAQEPAIAAIQRLGGTAIRRIPAPNSVIASMPATALDQLAAVPEVQAVQRAPELKPQLDVSAPAMGAPIWWSSGNTGGRGTADTSPADIAVLESGINEGNPAFAGVRFQDPPGSACNTTNVHGTAVAGVVASQGGTQEQDAGKRGSAYGADSVLNACWNGGGDSWAVGVDQRDYAGADDPAEVITLSSGSGLNGFDDDIRSEEADYIASAFGVSYVVAAGNSGPTAESVLSPSTAWNTISVGSINDAGTVSRGDDTVVDSSSRGTTSAGRKKPDLVAVGAGGARGLSLPDGNWRKPGDPEFRQPNGGTSFAAPQVAAGALLLAGAGVADSMARKAILINSAAPYDGQTGWRPDSGWGMLDLDRAFTERNNYVAGSVPAEGARFYAADTGTNDRATLTWYRRMLIPYFPFGEIQTIYTLSDLNLSQYDRSTQATQGTSDSSIDSVEQVRSPGSGQVVYKVKNASSTVDGLDAEPFALAASKQLQELKAPTLDQNLSLDSNKVGSETDVTAHVTIQNNGDLPVNDAQLTLDLPAGVELEAGDRTQQVGGGSLDPGETAAAQWTVRATGDGEYSLQTSAGATGWGETFTNQSSPQPLLRDSTAPAAALDSLPSFAGSADLQIGWSGSDGEGAGITSYDVEVRDGTGPWTPLETGTGETSTTFHGADGHLYAFRVRAADALGNAGTFPDAPQAETTVDTQPPELSVAAPAGVAAGEDLQVSVNASDATSGIATQTWQLDGFAPVGFAGDRFAVPAALLGSGSAHTLTIRATDGAGHVTQRQISLTIQRAAVVPTSDGRRAPQLRVRRVVVRGNSIYVHGSIARGATGTVRVKTVRASNTLTRTLALHARQWSARLTVSHKGRYRLRITYPGDQRFKPAVATRLVKVG